MKRLYIVTFVSGLTADTARTVTMQANTKGEARRLLAQQRDGFDAVNAYQEISSNLSVQGSCSVRNDDGNFIVDPLKTYSGKVTVIDIDPDDLEEAVTEYQVEVTITRTWKVYLDIETTSEDDIEGVVQDMWDDDRFRDEWDENCPDDDEFEVGYCMEK